jgi:crotonobetainyl-CoA:carnitine CoA-transferase CaiB-like acyl-CoA transferase
VTVTRERLYELVWQKPMARLAVEYAISDVGLANRIYRCADDAWFALAAAEERAWSALIATTGADVPAAAPALRTSADDPDDAERALEAVFATRARDEWVEALRAAGVPVEPIPDVDRTGFIERAVGDDINVALGRVHAFPWAERGRTEVMGGALRSGPDPMPSRRDGVPGLGERPDRGDRS